MFCIAKRWTSLFRAKLFPALLCCVSAHFIFAAAAFGQSRFEVWTSDNGLPQNSVYSILQTRDGYLWFTTLGGLVRYDGVRFTVFNKSNSEGIISNRFTFLYEDAEGSLWIGTEGSGLTRLKDGRFTTLTTENGLPDREIKAVRGDAEGRLWVSTSGGIAEWKGNRFVQPAQNEPTPEQLSGIRQMWRQTGFSFFDSTGFHIFVGGKIKTYTTRDGLSSININSVYEDRYGAFWIETKDKGLNRLKDGKFTVFPIQAFAPNDETRITAVCEDRKGNLWIARRGQGLSRWRENVVENFTAADSLSSNDIETIYEDREGNIWLGTLNNGLSRVTDHVFKVYSEPEGLARTNIYPMMEDRAGNIWIGTWDNYLYKFRDGAFTYYGKEQGLSYPSIGSLYEDAAGDLLVGTFGGGLNRLVDGKFFALKMPDDNIRAITQDTAGNLWFGTTNGLAQYSDGKFTVYNTADGLPDKEVQWLMIDRTGALWIGTLGGVANFKDGRFTAYTEREGLSSNHVRVIHEDRDGVIWVGTYDGGLSRIKDGRINRITMRDGLYDNGAFQILEDDRDNFWMSCNRGIYRVNRSELNEFADGARRFVSSIHYGKADGLLNTECNGGTQPAGFRARDGKLWFPTQNGVAVVDPREIHSNDLPPPVAIEEFILNNTPIVFRAGAQIPVGVESFEIHYTGLSFIRPEQVGFKYKLEGLDKDWVDAGTRRTAYYSHVPPGTYTFTVMAANSDGVNFTVSIDEIDKVLPREAEINLFRVVQESVNNIIKHSNATEAMVSIQKAFPLLHLNIHDNGKGFSHAASVTDAASSNGLGLRGIDERVRILGGKCAIESAPDKGTSIIVSIKLSEPEQRANGN